MINQVSSVKFTATGLDDAVFDLVVVQPEPILVRQSHLNIRRDELMRNFGYRVGFNIRITDVLQGLFDLNINRLSQIFNSTIHGTNKFFKFYPNMEYSEALHYNCMLDDTIEVFGENTTNTGHGFEFNISTVNRVTQSFEDFMQLLWYKG